MNLNIICEPLNQRVRPSETIDWDKLEDSLSSYYSEIGRPAQPIRLMCALLNIKQVENLSDAAVVTAWKQNPYFQYFSGEEYFQWELPCDSSNLTQFRNRIGEQGIKEIFRESIRVNGEAALEKELIADTTVQEKNITFPTDTKLHIKIIEECRKLASEHQITLRQSYRDTLKKLKKQVRFGKGKKQAGVKRKACKKLRTIAGRLIRELSRKLSNETSVTERMNFFSDILARQTQGCKKIYSTQEPEVKCHSKGKAHKKYEYGNKVSVATTKTSNVVVSVVSFIENIHDSKTIEPTLAVHNEMTGITAKKVLYDRGGRGCKQVGETEVVIPESGTGKSEYHKRKAKKDFRRRSAIEPIIGHLKHDFRMLRNYLKGTQGDAINALMAAAAFNFKRKMRIDFLLPYFLFKIKSIFLNILQNQNSNTDIYLYA